MPFVVMMYANSKQTHKATEADGERHSKFYDVLILPINIHTPPCYTVKDKVSDFSESLMP